MVVDGGEGSNGPALGRRGFLMVSAAASAAAGAALAWPGAVAAKRWAAPMTTRPIPSSGEALPVVGVGTWQTFDVGAGARARAPLRTLLTEMFAAGGTVIDSSPMYGRSEAVTGELLAELGMNERAFIATKVWISGREAGIAQMRQSMALLRTGRIDLMQVHNLVDWQSHMPTLGQWKEAGTIGYTGITHYTPGAFDDLARVMRAARPDFVQLPYSIGVRGAADHLLPLAAELGIAVLVNRPYEGGGLFRAVRRRTLPAWAAEFDCASWGQFFLKYILAHEAVTCVIPGTSKVAHLLDNAAAGRGRLPDATQRRRMVAFMSES